MDLNLGTATRRRAWGKAIRRVRPRFNSLFTAFAAMELKCPIHDAILIGLTDDKDKNYLEEIPNNDGFFQVLVGFDASIPLGMENDHAIERELFRQISRAILACPFAVPDRESIKELVEMWAKANLTAFEQ